MENERCREWYERSYKSQGFGAQRRYPNEELCRFMGRRFFDQGFMERKKIRILEVGCGSCSNLWMICREGFDAYGIDLSENALEIGKLMLSIHGGKAVLVRGDMIDIPFEDGMFDVVVDVVSSVCLSEDNYKKYVKELKRILKKNGIYFAYTPSKDSDEFIDAEEGEKIDKSTLAGAKDGYAYQGNNYPFRFMDEEDVNKNFMDSVWRLEYMEKIKRTYGGGGENFYFLVFEAKKMND